MKHSFKDEGPPNEENSCKNVTINKVIITVSITFLCILSFKLGYFESTDDFTEYLITELAIPTLVGLLFKN